MSATHIELKLKEIDWDMLCDDPTYDLHDRCRCCNRKVNPKTCPTVHIVHGGENLLHPDSEEEYGQVAMRDKQTAASELGNWFIGKDCLKRLGWEEFSSQ